MTTETDTRGLRILAAWRLGVPAVLVTMAAALTHHRTKAFSAAGQFRSRRRRK